MGFEGLSSRVVTCHLWCSMRLVETQLWQKKGPALVGLVPAMEASAAASAASAAATQRGGGGGSEGEEGSEKGAGPAVGLGQWLGVAATHFEPVDFQHSVGGAAFLHDDLQWHKRCVVRWSAVAQDVCR